MFSNVESKCFEILLLFFVTLGLFDDKSTPIFKQLLHLTLLPIGV